MKRFLTSSRPAVNQVVAALSAGLAFAGVMTPWAFPSVSLGQLTGERSAVHLTRGQQDWFTNLPLFLLIPGSVAGGALAELLGPRTLLLLMTPLLTAGVAAMHFASYKQVQDAGLAEVLLLAARSVQGASAALMNPTVSVYLCEVSEERFRGTLASLVDAWATFSFLVTYVVGSFVVWHSLALILPACLLVPAFFGLLASQESPLWLARKGKEKEALRVLEALRSSSKDVAKELDGVAASEEDASCWEKARMLVRKSNLVPIAVSVFLLQAKEFSGNNAVLIYMPQIFQQAGVGMPPSISSIVVMATRLGCNFVGSALLHRLPRKCLMLAGAALSTAATSALGAFFFVQGRGDDVALLSWLPMVALLAFTVGVSVGVGPASWLVAAEILPHRVRSLGFGISVTGYALASFLVSMTFEHVRGAWGSHGLFWAYSAGCVVYALHVLLAVPETRGRSLAEIEAAWGRRTSARPRRGAGEAGPV
ncbi:facilitated trehalose transporter Tret1-2 homolog [Penaeus chinensis]|uniref:facilitated trehalose transporter Tret1-2 homolog n=1 Tax=Penaeus chinensis TaxID=139456 RepID=UPI001FB85DB8|nr:facilitated trehalose transporter Tret1-2 homolog [Penaeus chinensis]